MKKEKLIEEQKLILLLNKYNKKAKASAHLVVGRDGSITQLAPFNVKTWHASKSHWAGLTGLNSHSIGIELDNAGELFKTGDKYKAWFKKEYLEGEVIRAKHKFRQDFSFWHDYTDIQIERALELTELLVEKYNFKDILGHEDIAPGRKIDPEPAFPLENIRAAILGRAEEEDELYEITVSILNTRRGPGIEYDTVSSPLSRGTKVSLLEMRDRWSKVDVEAENDFEGWVYNKYIKRT